MKKEDKLNIVWQPLEGSQELALVAPCDHILYWGTRGNGKDLDDTCDVLTQDGWKKVGDITYDDYLVAIDGSLTKILGIYPQGERDVYKVSFEDGGHVNCGLNHLWCVGNVSHLSRDGWKIENTSKLITRLNKGQKFGIPYVEGVGGIPWQGIDPYVVGYFLGNGCITKKCLSITTLDSSIVKFFEHRGWKAYKYDRDRTWVLMLGRKDHVDNINLRRLLPKVKADKKYVPKELLIADPTARLAVLQGLMDSDGCCTICKNRSILKFSSVSKQLAEDVYSLALSFGCRAGISEEDRVVTLGGKQYNSLRYVVSINTRNKINPFKLERKANKVKKVVIKKNTRRIVNIAYVGKKTTTCFAIAHPSCLFITQHYIVTHNTEVQLMRFRSYVDKGYGPFLRGIMFDREYKNLDDVIAKSKRLFHSLDDGARFHAGMSLMKWVFKDGAELLFRTCKDANSYFQYHGMEAPVVMHNELSKHPTSEVYDLLQSINRSSYVPSVHGYIGGTYDEKLGLPVGPNGEIPPPIPLETFSTCNPFGVGINWIKRRFIDPAPSGKIIRKTYTVLNPQTKQEEDVSVRQVSIYGTWRENKFLSPKYIAELSSIEDPVKRAAWYEGKLDALAGDAFGDLWQTSVHILPSFKIPKDWYCDRAFDFGSSSPFSVGWYCESNGEEVEFFDGSVRSFPSGTIIRFHEWYGTTLVGTNKGLKLSAGDIAEGIVEREDRLIKNGIVSSIIHPGPADNSIRDKREIDVDTIEKKMQDKGVYWYDSVKSPGSRINGFEIIRERLLASIRNEGPGLYVTDNCTAFISIFPNLTRDEKNLMDVCTDGEDHQYDELRYRCLAGNNRLATDIEFKVVY